MITDQQTAREVARQVAFAESATRLTEKYLSFDDLMSIDIGKKNQILQKVFELSSIICINAFKNNL